MGQQAVKRETTLDANEPAGWSSAIDPGKRKPDQQDWLGHYAPGDLDGPLDAREGYLFVIADGVGGEAHGDLASQTAGETILHEYREKAAAASDLPGLLARVIRIANKQVYKISAGSGMATTCVCLAIRNNQAAVAWVGDSRVYCWRGGVLTRWTTDHSWAFEYGRALVDDGRMTEEELATSKNRHKITRALGFEEAVEPGVLDPQPLYEGDRLLLCSDGLWDLVPEDYIAEQLGRTDISLQDIAGELAAHANRRGGKDNISLFVLDVTTVLRMLRQLAGLRAPGEEATAAIPLPPPPIHRVVGHAGADESRGPGEEPEDDGVYPAAPAALSATAPAARNPSPPAAASWPPAPALPGVIPAPAPEPLAAPPAPSSAPPSVIRRLPPLPAAPHGQESARPAPPAIPDYLLPASAPAPAAAAQVPPAYAPRAGDEEATAAIPLAYAYAAPVAAPPPSPVPPAPTRLDAAGAPAGEPAAPTPRPPRVSPLILAGLGALMVLLLLAFVGLPALLAGGGTATVPPAPGTTTLAVAAMPSPGETPSAILAAANFTPSPPLAATATLPVLVAASALVPATAAPPATEPPPATVAPPTANTAPTVAATPPATNSPLPTATAVPVSPAPTTALTTLTSSPPTAIKATPGTIAPRIVLVPSGPPRQALRQIAQAQGVTFAALWAFNKLLSLDDVQAGQTLDVPPATYQLPKELTYMVHGGDTLTYIATDFGTTARAIVRRNNLANENAISAGQELIIPITATPLADAGVTPLVPIPGALAALFAGQPAKLAALRVAWQAHVGPLNPCPFSTEAYKGKSPGGPCELLQSGSLDQMLGADPCADTGCAQLPALAGFDERYAPILGFRLSPGTRAVYYERLALKQEAGQTISLQPLGEWLRDALLSKHADGTRRPAV